MIILHDGGGAVVTEVFGKTLSDERWDDIRRSAARLLKARGASKAAKVMESFGFELRDGTNYFGDDFSVLYAVVDLDRYTKLAEMKEKKGAPVLFRGLAETISEIGPYTRFVAVELDTTEDRTVHVSPPTPEITSEAVNQALADAEHLIAKSGPASAIDRVHTALHGYLRATLDRAGLDAEKTDGLTTLFKRLRKRHPRWKDLGHGDSDLFKIIMGLATVIDALNVLRNQASLAHPNDVLESPEAMLAINSARTLLHYLDERGVQD